MIKPGRMKGYSERPWGAGNTTGSGERTLVFSFGKLKRLLPPPDGALIGTRYRETQSLTDPAELAAYIISRARDELALPMSVWLSTGRTGACFMDFDAPCPQPLVDDIAARQELLVEMEDWIERFSWSLPGQSPLHEDQRRFHRQLALREPVDVVTFGITWGTVEISHNSPWFRLRKRAGEILRNARSSKYAKWLALL
ncbi:hypothetical protein FXN61_35410 [Lentzea sp. PSKA42]|uniref:Uncharacterized protein n=1 Tax=Lentzea indica TaxID=2604800 RepID=A0ABX1FT07_9PSEU|nr:hypothetical protein [Lentzea indica]NKE61766.1 hypothetical protein [Lentzea indica]